MAGDDFFGTDDYPDCFFFRNPFLIGLKASSVPERAHSGMIANCLLPVTPLPLETLRSKGPEIAGEKSNRNRNSAPPSWLLRSLSRSLAAPEPPASSLAWRHPILAPLARPPSGPQRHTARDLSALGGAVLNGWETNTQPTPTDRTNTDPPSCLGLSLTAVDTKGPAGPRRAPNSAMPTLRGHRRRRRRCGCAAASAGRMYPQTATAVN